MNIERLRGLFVDEARTRLAALVEGLLRMEQGTADDALMEELLRHTHSLKGSAGLVGMHEVARLAHAMEDGLAPARSPGTAPPAVDGLLGLADRIETALGSPDGLDAVPGDVSPVEAGPMAEADLPSVEAAPMVEVDFPAAEAPRGSGRAADPTRPTGSGRLSVSVERIDEVVRLAGEIRSGLVRLRALLDRPGLDDDAPVLRELEHAARRLQQQAAGARTVPVDRIGPRLQRAVRDASRSRGVHAQWSLDGGDVEVDRAVLDRLEDGLLHVVRNSVAHGIEPPQERAVAGKSEIGQVRLVARSRGSTVQLEVSDDGRGIDREALLRAARDRGINVAETAEVTELALISGLSTTDTVDELAGRGVGMNVVAAAVRDVRGSVTVTAEPGMGTRVTLQVPLTLAVTRCLEVRAAGGRYALPLQAVVTLDRATTQRDMVGGSPVLRHDGQALPVVDLRDVLGIDGTTDGPVVVLRGTGRTYALRVDSLVRQGEITVQAPPAGMPGDDRILGVSIASDGSVLVVLDPAHLLDPSHGTRQETTAAEETTAPHVLVVDDTLTIRELQRGILTSAGYTVSTATDGRDALAQLAAEDRGGIDLVVTDVEMPLMDGYALTEAIRSTPTLATLPVLILTTLADDTDQRRGLEAGADGYLLKGQFTAEGLVSAVASQVGRP